MKIEDVEKNVASIPIPNSFDIDFVYDLLLAYGKPRSSITRLKAGTYNLSDQPGEIYWKRNLFFMYVEHEDLHYTIDRLRDSKEVLRHNPRFIVVTDFLQILAVDMKTEETLDIRLNEIAKNFTFFLPWAGMEKSSHKVESLADVRAAEKMARLYDEIRKTNQSLDPDFLHSLNVFFSRLLFCFFAEDTEVFTKGQFVNSIASHTQPDGSDLADYLEKLFTALDIENKSVYPSHIKAFPYVNGRLFAKRLKLPSFSAQARKLIIECGELNWSQINPDIFGSMIQAVVHPGQRAGLGMHYTSVVNIMKVIEPLFLEELKEEFDKVCEDEKRLLKLLKRIYNIKVFDPACGSGNFLIIAYKELRKLEHRIIERINELSGGAVTLFQMSGIQLENFYGIEIDDFAHEVAILSLWLAKHQMNIEFKAMFNIEIPLIPLKDAGNIVCDNATRIDWDKVCPNKPRRIGDAYYRQGKLTSDEHEQVQLIDEASLAQNEWNEIYLIGNPPYQGAKLQDKSQKDDFKAAFGHESYSKNLDYISIWFIKGSRYIKDSAAEMAFVSTNSICQGEHVSLLWPFIYALGLEISFAHTSFKWSNNAKGNAGVTCIIVGLRNKDSQPKHIYVGDLQYRVDNINAYLAPSKSNVIVERNSLPISDLPRMEFGNMPLDGGNLILTPEEKRHLIDTYPTAKTLVKKLYGSREFLNDIERWCLWISDAERDEALEIPEIRERVKKTCKMRLESSDVGTQLKAQKPYQFREMKVSLRHTLIVPRVSSERREYIPIGYLDKECIVSDSAQAIYDAEPFVFGLISSRMHMTWVRAVAGRLKTDYRYSSAIVYNNFPVPRLTEKQKEMIATHVFEVLGARENHSEKTLSEMYDPDKMPIDLKQAHADLDEVVDRCYRSKPFENDEDRLAHLFKLYEEMTQKEKEVSRA